MLKASRVMLRVSARALLVSASSYAIGFVTKWIKIYSTSTWPGAGNLGLG